MTVVPTDLASRAFDIEDLFRRAAGEASERLIASSLFSRSRLELPEWGSVIRDDFTGSGGAACLFLRLCHDAAPTIQLALGGERRIHSCAAGGWLLESVDRDQASYWVPRLPDLRSFDMHARIVEEAPASIGAFASSPQGLSLTIDMERSRELDCVLWRIPTAARAIQEDLQNPQVLERWPTFLWSSKSLYRLPADLYAHVVNGHVFQNARAWPRKWRFCCELDACELFVWLTGLELATGKPLYNLLRRQILLSVMARQSADGGWHHGEWTDLNESHYRFHNGALQLLENACDEWNDPMLRASLARGAAFVASRTDRTDFGLWFMHDSLECSATSMDEMHRQTGSIVKGFGAWRPTYLLGKSATNKLILNTHVDTTVTLDRYGCVTGDRQYQPAVDSAREATRRLLALRPADTLYRLAYRAVGWTLLPEGEARRLPLPVRALKRLVSQHVLPRLYLLKHRYPRIVMPGGFVDRHISPMHFDAKYHAVNILDLVRQQRRFPDDRLEPVIDGAIQFVVRNKYATLRWWSESKPRRFAVVVFAEALYHLCMLLPYPRYRKHLAQALLVIDDQGLGLPPSLLGGNAEITGPSGRVPCPTPVRPGLRVANLSTPGRAELLIVNPTDSEQPLEWESAPVGNLTWTTGDGASVILGERPLHVPPRGWLWGRAHAAQ